MRINDFKKVLPYLLKHKIVPFVWGNQGVGKTQTMKQYCKENDLQLVVLNTATQEVGDLVGLLVKSKDNETVEHARPTWFPTEGKGIVFLDELNRAPQEVIQALFPFVIEGQLHTHKLPPGWCVVAAGNYQSDKFTVTDTSDAAWLSRFCHLDFTPSVEEWLYYVETKGGLSVADFIREQNSMLELNAKEGGKFDNSIVTPDRRAWTEGIVKLENEATFPEELRYETYAGLVGSVAAASFTTWKIKQEKSITLSQILSNYAGTRSRVLSNSENSKDKRFDLFNQPIEELFIKLEHNANYLSSAGFLDNLKAYLLDIPKELSMKCFIRMAAIGQFHGKNEILNDPKYVENFR